MGICLTDGEVFRLETGKSDKAEILTFFLNGHQESLVAVYDESGNYQGVVTYQYLLYSKTVEDSLIKDKIYFNEEVWQNASNVLTKYPYLAKVPVLTDDDDILYLAENSAGQTQLMMKLCRMIKADSIWEKISSVSIKDTNEVLFYLEKILRRKNIRTVIEKHAEWEKLGVCSAYGEDMPDGQCDVVDGDWIDRLYTELKRERGNKAWNEEYWNCFCNEVKEKNASVIFCGTPDSVSEKVYDFLLQEGICPEAVFGLDGYHTLWGKEVNAASNLTNVIWCVAGIWSDTRINAIFEMILRRQNGYCDNIYLLSELGYHLPDTMLCNLIRYCGRVVLTGERRLCRLLGQVCEEWEGVEAVYVEDETDIIKNADMYADALWFYTDFWSKKDDTRLKRDAAICRKKGIYLSRFFLHHYEFYKDDIGGCDFEPGEISELQCLKEVWRMLDKCNAERDKRMGCKRNILFLSPEYSYMWSGLVPLFDYYRKNEDVQCTVMFYSMKEIAETGIRNLEETVDNIREIIRMGGYACLYGDWYPDREYDVCYVPSGYSYWHNFGIGDDIRNICRMIVSLQTTAFHTHYYIGNRTFEDMFAERQMKEIDYVVLSAFMTDWVGQREQGWNDKLLPYGYPRMDYLYNDLREGSVDISDEWKAKIKGKKVIYFTSLPADLALYCFRYCEDDKCVLIWRPHPYSFESPQLREEIRKWESKKNVIIDTNLSYNMAFQCADALITTFTTSVMINYLFTDKPFLILDKGFLGLDDNHVGFQDEAWYKAGYVANDQKTAEAFIDMIIDGRDDMREEKMVYRQYMQQGFDGKVCSRIAGFVEERLQVKSLRAE